MIDIIQQRLDRLEQKYARNAGPFERENSVKEILQEIALYALARAVQKHARLLSVLETLDNGKPIRETRDLDIPLVARDRKSTRLNSSHRNTSRMPSSA